MERYMAEMVYNSQLRLFVALNHCITPDESTAICIVIIIYQPNADFGGLLL